MSEPDIHTDIAEMIRIAGEDWVDKRAAAKLLEDQKSAEFARRMNEFLSNNPGTPFNRAESSVKGDQTWFDHIAQIVEADRLAGLARVKYVALQAQLNVWQTRNSLKRAEQWSNRGA